MGNSRASGMITRSTPNLWPTCSLPCSYSLPADKYAFLNGQWEISLHLRLSVVATSQWTAIEQALAGVELLPDVPDRRSIGQQLLPFSSRAFYQWHMEQQPDDEFFPSIWTNIVICVVNTSSGWYIIGASLQLSCCTTAT